MIISFPLVYQQQLGYAKSQWTGTSDMTHTQEGLSENSSLNKKIARGFNNIWLPFGPSNQALSIFVT
jgi:hypothetical protein